ncbi:MAG: DNA sulfur modification protein DndD [Nitrosospira sp.]|nr:DNA sulfur modification protein DndD [Nitrosospira sp.]MDN5880738.1 DNA sulfur modification protein DndD [Nitrosospira sp.]
MIFEQIRIQNLFSYYGEQTFDFPFPTPDKPVVLISGRNGFGKTSFITSVKLLFLGTSEVMLRDTSIGATFRPHTYLLGMDHIWQGVFNRDAREQRLSEYGITLIWREEKGRVTVRRYWRYDGGELEPYLSIEADFNEDGLGLNKLIDEPEEAEEFLQRRLPRDIVPFFFYDGEKVQQLAEANQEGLMRQIEKLLGLAAVDTLDQYLELAVKAWKRDGTAINEQAEYNTLGAKLQLKQAERAKAQAAADDVEADLENLEREIRRHARQIESIRTQVLQRDTPHLKEKMMRAKDSYELLCQRVAASLPMAAPLWAAPELVQGIANQLEGAVTDASQRLAEEIRGVFERLPARLFDEPPHPSPRLSEPQKLHYRQKLGAILSQYTEPSTGGFFSLNSDQTIALKRRIDYFFHARNERQRLADDLREVGRLRREWQQAKAEVEAIDELSPEQKQVFHEREAEMVELRTRRDDLIEQRGKYAHYIGHHDAELERLATQISQQETKLVKASINSHQINRAQQARRVFELYGNCLKKNRRAEIEIALNQCFKQLMTSHHQISNIKLNENFALSYRDTQDREIGLANISAGMKQLTAQALLWALSDVSGRGVPVIVDTPLARIDRLHQENLLRNYYPKAAQQVIVLPTDSELDADKYGILKPWVNAEFRLENPNGDRTRIERDTAMYTIEEA